MCRFGMKRANDPPLYAGKMRRLRQGLYEITLYLDAKRVRKYHGDTRFHADNMAQAIERCRRMYPSVVFNSGE